MTDERVVRQASARRDDRRRTATLRATVLSVDRDGQRVWVQVEGGAERAHAAIASGVTVSQGDAVAVLFERHAATVTGSYDMRATDDTAASKAAFEAKYAALLAKTSGTTAELAQAAADSAMESASVAYTSAQAAVESAEAARTAAQSATEDANEAKAAADTAQAQAKEAYEASAEATSTAAQAATKAAEVEAAARQATQDASDASLAAVDAGKAAATAQAAAEAAQGGVDETQRWFYHDELGSHVLSADGDHYRTDVTPKSLDVVDTSSGATVATFGEKTRIGELGLRKTHVDITPETIALGSGVEAMDANAPKALEAYLSATDASSVWTKTAQARTVRAVIGGEQGTWDAVRDLTWADMSAYTWRYGANARALHLPSWAAEMDEDETATVACVDTGNVNAWPRKVIDPLGAEVAKGECSSARGILDVAADNGGHLFTILFHPGYLDPTALDGTQKTTFSTTRSDMAFDVKMCVDGDDGSAEFKATSVRIGPLDGYRLVADATSARVYGPDSDAALAEVRGGELYVGGEPVIGSLAPVEGGTASRTYASGELVSADGRLGYTTAQVTQGKAFVVGTNFRAAKVADVQGTPCFVYATVPTEATVKANHPVPCFVFVTGDSSLWYVS